MARASWGSVTKTESGGGGANPNILKLEDSSRIRLLEPEAVKWRQHGIRAEDDDEQFRSVVCPKGPDGRDDAPCPLCMKPADSEGKQRFNVSIRFATNVWDYKSESVKILVGGKQIFSEFDAAGGLGIDPTASDWIINKSGSGQQTKYKMVRADQSPFLIQVDPSDLHDLSQFDVPDSTEKIFEKLEALGIDYDSLEVPSYTIDEAEAFVMPYTKKHKGETLEQIYTHDKEFMLWLHDQKLSQGQLGDPVFLAMHTVLLHYGDTEPLEIDEMAAKAPKSAPPAPAPQAQTKAPTEPFAVPPEATATISLIDPAGNLVEVPAAAKDSLLGVGFTEPAPEPAAPSGMKTLIGPDGKGVEVPEAAVGPMLAAGYKDPSAARPDPTPEPTAYRFPDDGDEIQFQLKMIPTPVPMAFKDARRLLAEGQGAFVDKELQEAVEALGVDEQADAIRDASRAGEVETPDPEAQAAIGDDLDPNLTHEVDGGFAHPAVDGVKKTKGAVTQALNKIKKEREAAAAAPAPATQAPAPAASQPAPEGKEAKLEAAKNLLATMPEIQSDFTKLLDLFARVADGKRNISDFSESDLDALISELEAMAD
jgi:hypothetical protein